MLCQAQAPGLTADSVSPSKLLPTLSPPILVFRECCHGFPRDTRVHIGRAPLRLLGVNIDLTALPPFFFFKNRFVGHGWKNRIMEYAWFTLALTQTCRSVGWQLLCSQSSAPEMCHFVLAARASKPTDREIKSPTFHVPHMGVTDLMLHWILD